jgi:putative transcriptional regulator
MTGNEYHYTECGLDDAYLVSGFEFVDVPKGGRRVIIINIDGLHKVIGESLVNEKKNLNGSDLRFLRHEMLMSQALLAVLFDVSEQTVHRWESRKTDISKPAESLVRLLYREHIGRDDKIQNNKIHEVLRRIADLEDEIDELRLEATVGEWVVKRAA